MLQKQKTFSLMCSICLQDPKGAIMISGISHTHIQNSPLYPFLAVINGVAQREQYTTGISWLHYEKA